MNGWLSKIKNTVDNLWGVVSAPGMKLGEKIYDVTHPQPLQVSSPPQQQAPTPTATPTATPTPTPYPSITPQDILMGLSNFAGNNSLPPIANNVDELAALGNMIKDRINPYFIAALALRESGGGTTSGVMENNPFGIMNYDQTGGRTLAQYPDMATSIMGGGPNNQLGLKGVLNSGVYNNFLQSGNLADFFNSYSPPSENASVDEQIRLLQELLNYFPQK